MLQNISIWGDSLLQGVILDEKQGRYSILEDNCITSLATKMGLQVTNHSKFGCTAPKGRKILRKALEADEAISVALIEFGGNDCDFNWGQVAAQPEKEHMPRTPLGAFITCYTDMIESLKQRGITPVLVSLPPLDAERYFRWITRTGLSRDSILDWLGDVQHIYRWHERYSNAVINLAREYSLRFVDIRDAFLSERNFSSLICADGIHPNRKGHAVMERVLFESAVRYLN